MDSELDREPAPIPCMWQGPGQGVDRLQLGKRKALGGWKSWRNPCSRASWGTEEYTQLPCLVLKREQRSEDRN